MWGVSGCQHLKKIKHLIAQKFCKPDTVIGQGKIVLVRAESGNFDVPPLWGTLLMVFFSFSF